MKPNKLAAPAAALLLPTSLWAQDHATIPENDVDEVVVVGRSVATGLARIEVDREMLVDTATVLKDIPGANVNANGPVTGIAQYRGMYGDRISVVVDHLGIVSGGPNATITRRMFNALRDQIDPTIASISTILIAISCTLLVIAQVFGKSKDER